MDIYEIGKTLKMSRRKKRLTQEQAAKLINTNPSTISRIENGEVVSMPTVLDYCKLLHFELVIVKKKTTIKDTL